MSHSSTPQWHTGYADLPATFHQPVEPTPVPDPYFVAWHPGVAIDLGLPPEPPGSGDLLDVLAGNRVPAGSRPTAAAYAGHQFGTWVHELGDGRAIVLGELEDLHRVRQEIQLKGAGLTRWSRMGDGRAVLRSTIREYLASAAMEGLGIPTTRALAIVGSDLPVLRERLETAAVLTRVAPTHVRFGSFEYLAARRMDDERALLADWVIERQHPELLRLPAEARHAAWYGEIVARTARLMAMWTTEGFQHGVMNTDNFSILGLTIDYGPYGFMDTYDPTWVCNHSDHGGRYAFDQQPSIGLWNCARLGEALYPLVAEGPARTALEGYRTIYGETMVDRMRAKLGLATAGDDDVALITDWLELQRGAGADYHRSFRALSRWDAEVPASREPLAAEIADGAALDAWLATYRARLGVESRPAAERHAAMLAVNPKYVLRNWVAQEAIQNAETRNHARVDEIRRLLDAPFDEHPGWERYAEGPPAWARDIAVSCSS
jgi:uncharacterized protein YdiU (UPF0061 family)